MKSVQDWSDNNLRSWKAINVSLTNLTMWDLYVFYIRDFPKLRPEIRKITEQNKEALQKMKARQNAIILSSFDIKVFYLEISAVNKTWHFRSK